MTVIDKLIYNLLAYKISQQTTFDFLLFVFCYIQAVGLLLSFIYLFGMHSSRPNLSITSEVWGDIICNIKLLFSIFTLTEMYFYFLLNVWATNTRCFVYILI
jgi:hypothetical protein